MSHLRNVTAIAEDSQGSNGAATYSKYDRQHDGLADLEERNVPVRRGVTIGSRWDQPAAPSAVYVAISDNFNLCVQLEGSYYSKCKPASAP
jgi:hypothetical protein